MHGRLSAHSADVEKRRAFRRTESEQIAHKTRISRPKTASAEDEWHGRLRMHGHGRLSARSSSQFDNINDPACELPRSIERKVHGRLGATSTVV